MAGDGEAGVRPAGRAPVVIGVIDAGFQGAEQLADCIHARAQFGADGVADCGSHGTLTALTIAQIAGRAATRFVLARVIAGGTAEAFDRATAEAIDFAVAHGARVICFGWVSAHALPQVERAMRRAAHDALFVAPAGNHTGDLDQNPWYPAALGNDNLIVATSERLLLLGPREDDVGYGSATVDVVVAGCGAALLVDGVPRPSLGDTSGAAGRLAAQAAIRWRELGASTPIMLKADLLEAARPPPDADQARLLERTTVSGGLLAIRSCA